MKRKISRTLATLAVSIAMPLTVLTVVAGPASAADPATDWNNYEKITLTKDVGEPIDLAVMPDSRVLHTARNGDLRLTDPATGVTKITNHIDVYSNSEMGLQTVTLDPGFSSNKWVYLYYAPREMSGTANNGAPFPATTPSGNAPNTLPDGADLSYWNQWQGYDVLSRFKWDDATDSLDLSTEQQIIKVQTNRGQCCHEAGDVGFDADGNLYLATGDNTPASTPGANGMAPNNNAPGFNPGFDDRRGAGNTNDLRGSILRIHVQDDGSYTIPEGNLFPESADTDNKTRPEIFVKGVRNPFRINVDTVTHTLSWGDYGPDAGQPIAERGPMGYVEWNITPLDKAMEGGWPYCTGDQFNYNEWNYETETPGPWFDCAAGPVNNSTWNTGLHQLPPATPADIYYGDNADDQPAAWHLLTDLGGGGQAPMGGPIYHFDADNPSTTKFPAYWDSKAFMAEFSQDYVVAFTVDYPDGPVTNIEDFLPNAELSRMGQPIWDNVMDMEFGPDGSMYVLEYGDGFFRQNPDSGLYRVDYSPGNKAPQAHFTETPNSSSEAPLTVTFDASASVDPEGQPLTYEWFFDDDDTVDATGVTVTHTYTELGGYTARLRVTDPGGRFGVTSRTVSVGNQAPTVTVDTPANGGFFNWGDYVPFTITTNDPEEGTATDCSRVTWTFGLGHNTHAHPLFNGTGCTGAWATPADAPEHGETENIYGVVVIRYTDAGHNGLPGATGETTLTLNPKTQEGEWADQLDGVTVTEDSTASAGSKVTSFDAGDSLVWDPVAFTNIDSVVTRASGAGTLSLRWNSADAEPFATVTVPAGAGWQEVTTDLADAPEGSGTLFVTSTGGVDVDSFTFQGDGVSDVTGPEVTVETDPAEPNGQNGWFTSSPVTVDISADDVSGVGRNAVEYHLASRTRDCDDDDDEWGTWPRRGGVDVTDEGSTVVCYRATDNAGNVTTGNYTVRIDTQNPVVTLPGVDENGMVTDSIYLVPAIEDASGGVFDSMTLDGESWSIARPINLAALDLGEHTLVVEARDAAGHTVTSTLTFTTTASFDGLRALIDRYTTSRAIKSATASGLLDRLDHAEDALAAGQESRAVSYLEQFISRTKSVSSTGVRTLLKRDAGALIDSIED
jgi:glucose/arabinose dehydrogenase